jgi:hypothetical protein
VADPVDGYLELLDRLATMEAGAEAKHRRLLADRESCRQGDFQIYLELAVEDSELRGLPNELSGHEGGNLPAVESPPAMWEGKTLSVVLMTYAERDSIRRVIDGFVETGVVDEVVVVNNNAEEGTAEEIARTKARQVFEPRQGYGHAIRRGLVEASGDLVLLAEPDGTFLPEDISKMLVYSGECEAVLGTRTTRELIWRGANMGWFLRWGNWAVAKFVEVIFNTSHLSDMGCSYRLFNRRMADYVAETMKIGQSHAGAEILMLVIVSGARFVEIPVNYLPRVGKSSVTGHPLKVLDVGLRMIWLVLRFRLKAPRRLPRPEAFDGQARVPSGFKG